MTLEVLAWAPDQKTAHAFMQAIGIVDEDINPIVSVQIDEIGSIVQTPAVINPVTMQVTTPAVLFPGYYVNVRYYGDSEAALIGDLPQTDSEGNLLDLFDRTHLLDLAYQRAQITLTWSAFSNDPLPPGYMDILTTVKLYDPAMVPNRSRVWA